MMNRRGITWAALAGLLPLVVGCSTPLREPNALWSEGATAFRQEDYPAAVDRFSALLAHPDLSTNKAPRVLYWKAQAHLKLEQHVEAYRCFKDLTWKYPASYEARWVRASQEGALRAAIENDALSEVEEATNNEMQPTK